MTQRSWEPDDSSVLTALRPAVPAPRRADDWLGDEPPVLVLRSTAQESRPSRSTADIQGTQGAPVAELERSWAPDPWDPDTRRLVPLARARPDRTTASLPKRLANAAFNAVVAVVVLAFLGLAIGPHTGKYQTTTMLTGSMRPAYPPGSVLVITPQPVSELAPGQVITFHAPTEDRRIVTHRVVSVDRSREFPAIVTKGDANNGNDPWIAAVKTDVVWRVRFVVPGLGRAIQELREPRVQFALTRVLPGLLLASLLVAVWRPERKHA